MLNTTTGESTKYKEDLRKTKKKTIQLKQYLNKKLRTDKSLTHEAGLGQVGMQKVKQDRFSREQPLDSKP